MHKWSIVLPPPGIYQELVEFLSFSPVFPIIIDKAARYIGNHTTPHHLMGWADVCNIYCVPQSSHEVCLIRINQETIRLCKAVQHHGWPGFITGLNGTLYLDPGESLLLPRRKLSVDDCLYQNH